MPTNASGCRPIELNGGFGGLDALGTDPRACASSSFKWFKDLQPLTFAELGEMGFKFTFITLGGQHATGLGLSALLAAMAERQEQGYIRSSAASGKLGRSFPRVATTSGAAFPITTS